MLGADDWAAIRLTLELATVTTLLLLLLGTPLAWWLAHSQSRWRPVVGAITTLPLVLPPTVIGFYLLLLLGPQGAIGQLTSALGLGTLPFTFGGLVVASIIYSLPFVVQPLQGAFISLGERPLELAASLRAGPLDRFIHVVLPLCRPGFFTAAVMGFAHTIGEFGVVLMIGGNISGQTRVVSVQIYDQVEKMNYGQAHWLAAGMVLLSFAVLLLLYRFNPHARSTP